MVNFNGILDLDTLQAVRRSSPMNSRYFLSGGNEKWEESGGGGGGGA